MKSRTILKALLLSLSPLVVSACMISGPQEDVLIEASPFSSLKYSEFLEDLESLGYQAQETFDATQEILGFQVEAETFTNSEQENTIDIFIYEGKVIALYGYLQHISQFIDPTDFNHEASGTNLSTVVNENHDLLLEFLADDLFYNEENDRAISMNFFEDDYEYRLIFLNEQSKPVLEEITNLQFIELE